MTSQMTNYVRKTLGPALIGVVISMTFAASSWILLGQAFDTKFAALSILGIVPGLIIGMLLHVNAKTMESLEALRTDAVNILNAQTNLELFRGAFTALESAAVGKADFYEFLVKLLHQARDRILSVPIPAREFVNLSIRGVKSCDQWRGVHQGDINLLFDNKSNAEGMHRYLEAFAQNTSSKLDAKRLIIVSEDNGQWIEEPTIVEKVLRLTKKVENYIVLESDVREALGTPVPEFDDSATFNGILHLSFDRSRRMLTVSFDAPNAGSIETASAMDALFRELQKDQTNDYKMFRRIDSAYLKQLRDQVRR